jgi:medium-chain acyl-[acyl-carrier-protein] hydrolase
MSEAMAQKWLLSNGKPVAGAKVRIICLGWAGANSNVFKTWDLKCAEVVKVELPSRNARFNDKPIHDVNILAKKISQACFVMGYLESTTPLVIFGHSFGAMIGLHLARIMKKEYDYTPKMCIFGGCRPLHR